MNRPTYLALTPAAKGALDEKWSECEFGPDDDDREVYVQGWLDCLEFVGELLKPFGFTL